MFSDVLSYLQRSHLATGILGTASSVGASAVTFFSQVDLVIRVMGGLFGLAIAVVTLLIQIHAYRSRQNPK